MNSLRQQFQESLITFHIQKFLIPQVFMLKINWKIKLCRIQKCKVKLFEFVDSERLSIRYHGKRGHPESIAPGPQKFIAVSTS